MKKRDWTLPILFVLIFLFGFEHFEEAMVFAVMVLYWMHT